MKLLSCPIRSGAVHGRSSALYCLRNLLDLLWGKPGLSQHTLRHGLRVLPLERLRKLRILAKDLLGNHLRISASQHPRYHLHKLRRIDHVAVPPLMESIAFLSSSNSALVAYSTGASCAASVSVRALIDFFPCPSVYTSYRVDSS